MARKDVLEYFFPISVKKMTSEYVCLLHSLFILFPGADFAFFLPHLTSKMSQTSMKRQSSICSCIFEVCLIISVGISVVRDKYYIIAHRCFVGSYCILCFDFTKMGTSRPPILCSPNVLLLAKKNDSHVI